MVTVQMQNDKLFLPAAATVSPEGDILHTCIVQYNQSSGFASKSLNSFFTKADFITGIDKDYHSV